MGLSLTPTPPPSPSRPLYGRSLPSRRACRREQGRSGPRICFRPGHPPQGITLTKALEPGTAEHRMIGNLVLDAELAKPPVGKIDLHVSANPSL
jgi:hypothetical protein